MINFSVAAAGEMMVGLRTAIDIGGAAGYVRLYAGTRPATGGTPTTLVATCPLAHPCGTIDAAGALAFDPGANGLVLVSTTPTWARIFTSAGDFVADCNCRLIGDAPAPDPEEIVIDALGIVAGAYVSIAGGTIAAPG